MSRIKDKVKVLKALKETFNQTSFVCYVVSFKQANIYCIYFTLAFVEFAFNIITL